MKKLQNKSKISAITFVILLTISAMLVALPTVAAQDVRTKATHAFIGAVPNPVGVTQPVLLHVGITDYMLVSADGWEGLTVTIVDPEGIETSIGPIRTDATGGTGRMFTPTKVGTYTLQTHFPAQEYTWMYPPMFDPEYSGTILYEASTSEPLELVVQDESIPYYPGNPLPSEYWTRPIDAQLREWYKIAGNWLWGPGPYGGADIPNHFAPYNDNAPETAHILWTKPMTTGGVAGGETREHSFECGDAYEGKFGGSLIIAGKLYYMDTSGGFMGAVRPVVYHCVDLHTGEELWAKTFLDNQTISFGQLFYWDSYNYHGVFAYLWVTVGGAAMWGPPMPETWYAFDAYTGNWMYTIENVPSGTTIRGPKGEIYRLQVDQQNGWMALWNSSALGSMEGSWGNSVHLRTLDAGADTAAAQRAWSWNVTIDTGYVGSVQAAWLGDRVVGGSISTEEVSLWGLSLEAGNEGHELFTNTWNAPAEWASGNVSINWGATSLEDSVLVLEAKETVNHYAFSLDTGKFLWVTDSEHYMNMYTNWGTTWGPENLWANIAYGKLFSTGMAGIVYCYDVSNGTLLWSYEANDPYQEILWANNWPIFEAFATDGKIYLYHSEHSPMNPKGRGAPFICLNVTDGSEVWRVDGLFRGTYWGGTPLIGDSIIALYESYDQRVYAIGKGASAITVEAPLAAVTQGLSVTIKGTVMDVSPGTEDTDLQIRFPNGVPAISDDDMGEWMKYVYKQFERPEDATGVPVKLAAIDPHGEYFDIDTATTDTSGNYGFTFKPETEGKYTILATFYGSKAYYGSTTTTYLAVDAAPEEIDLTPLEGSVSDVEGSVNAVEGSVSDLQGSVDSLEDSVTGLEGSVTGLDGSVSDVEGSIGGLESSISNLTTYIIAILALVIVALVIAVYSILKSSK